MKFFSHPYLIGLVTVLSWPVYKLLAKLFFGENYEDFRESVRYFFQCDWVSLFRGEYWEDVNATFKIKYFLATCVVWVMAVSEVICKIAY